MITHIMDALNLQTQVDSTLPPTELSQKKISVDMSEMYLRPTVEGNKAQPSQMFRKTLGQPPVCACGQQHTNWNDNSCICSDSYGEAYFDLEEGLWVKSSPSGTEVHFDEDSGRWFERVRTGPPGEENKERLSQDIGKAPESPPVCSCGQSDTPDQSGKSCICSNLCEPYFNPEEGLWKSHDGIGSKAYFDQDSRR
ncbi:hypothetical protein BDV23DRAFT_162271 [Aspergillus alliaceus]|uniref:Uncharacterized protein n=1 Tax=Petromyces alliaceus TaxID=209559 RepID=A0A5N7BYP5_PETAA|nr:hypothetical protein BDV23DRAFT_162271 [Aspergillus alliaceus]